MTKYATRGRSGWLLAPLLVAGAAALILFGLSLYFHAFAPTPYYGYPYPGLWFGWPFPVFGWFFIPLLFFAVLFGFRWCVWGGWGWRRGWCGGGYDPALDALRERYARGEITKEQLYSMMKDLEG